MFVFENKILISDQAWEDYRNHFYPVKIHDGKKIVDRANNFKNAQHQISKRNNAAILLGFEPKDYKLQK